MIVLGLDNYVLGAMVLDFRTRSGGVVLSPFEKCFSTECASYSTGVHLYTTLHSCPVSHGSGSEFNIKSFFQLDSYKRI